MADLDKDLTLKIAANANEANEAIDGLISRLRTLNNSLNLGNLQNFTRQLNQLALSANKLDGSALKGFASGLSALEKAQTNLKGSEGIKAIGTQADFVKIKIHEMAKELANGTRDSVRVAKELEEKLTAIYDLATNRIGGKGFSAVDDKFLGSAIESMSDLITENIKFSKSNKDAYDTYSRVRDYINHSGKIKVPVGDLDKYEHWMSDMAVIGTKHLSTTQGQKIDDFIEELVGEFKELEGVINASANAGEQFKALAEYLRQCKKESASVYASMSAGERAAILKHIPEEAGDAMVKILDLANESQNFEKRFDKAPFQGLSDVLTVFQEISLPDFSSLDVLANALTKLQRVDPEKILSIASAVKGININVNVNTNGLDNVAESAKNIGNTSPEVKQAAEAANEMAESIAKVGEQAKATINTDGVKQLNEEAKEADAAFKELQEDVGKKPNTSGLSALSEEMQRISERISEVKKKMSDMEKGKADWNVEEYKGLERELGGLSARYDEILGKTKAQKSGNINLLASLVALGHELQTVASTFDKWGDAGIRLVKVVFSPLRHEFEEFKSKISGISNAMKNLRASMQKHLTKMSAFWKRAMKTFTFMLVRKAITAILNETKTAVDSLAMWSNQFGTAFNGSMGEIVANASYLARSLVAMFEPIINAIIPILNMLVDALGRAARAIAEFFAAFTGQDYFMVAKKKVGNYTDSLKKANKAQKNLTMGIDELNILSENQSGGSDNPLGGFADEWDTAPVSDKMKKLVEDLKGILAQLFEPLKKAWDLAGDYVIDGFKWMKRQLGDLFKSIGRDFLEVWNQPETVQMLANILRIVGDIEFTVGNLAYKFRQAWEEGEKGKHIFEAIRDIMAILIQHVRNVTLYMRGWSQRIDFNPLLESALGLLEKMKPLAEFIGGVFEDVMKNVVLKYIEFLIETGIPHLMNTIGEILDAFDFTKLRIQLMPLEFAFENMLENIDTGITNAIGKVGKAVAEFTQSEEFQKFLDNLEWFMRQITVERVEKFFTILGSVIVDLAQKLAGFVGSDKFRDFMNKLFKWFDNADEDKIVDAIERLALAIGAFKFAGFVGKGLSGFISFLSVVSSAKNVAGILGSIGASASTIAPLAGTFAVVAISVKSFVDSFGGIQGAADRLKQTFSNIGGFITELGEKFNISDKVNALKEAFVHLNGSLGNMKDFWNIILAIFEEVARQVSLVVVPIFAALVDSVTGLIEIFDGFIQILGGLSSVIVGICTGDFPKIKEGVQGIIDGVNTVMAGFYDALVKPIIDAVQGVIEWFAYLFDVLLGHSIIPDIVNGIVDGFTGMVTTVINTVKGLVNKVVGFFKDLWNKVVSVATKIKEEVVGRWNALVEGVKALVTIFVTWVIGKWNELKQKVVETVTQLKDNIIQKWNEIKSNVEEKVRLIKEYIIEKWNEIKAKAEELWNKIKEKIITPIQEAWDKLFGADGLIATMVSKAKAAWDQIKKDVEEVLVKVKDAIIAPFKDAWDALFGENGWVTKLIKKIKGAFEDISGDEITKMLKGVADAIIAPFKEAYDKAMGEDGWVTKLLKGIDDFFDGIKKAIENSPLGKFFQNIADKIDKLKEKLGGLKDDAEKAESSTRTSSVQGYFNGGFVQYATGGYPSRGTLFWAGEYGLPEMLGTVGGKTAVASSAEITGIRESVMESSIAEQNMMGQMINLLQAIAAKDTSVNLDSRELVSSLNDRARRNGYNFVTA